MDPKKKPPTPHTDSNIRKRKYPWEGASDSSESLSANDETHIPVYEKIQGSGHLLGPEFQYLMCAHLALKCLTDDRVCDFEITTNENRYKVFDDIALKTTLQDGRKLTFLFQLKHGAPQRNLKVGDFARQALRNKSYLKNHYCFANHINFIKDIEEDNVVCILYTNNTTSLTENLVLDFEKYKVRVEKCDDFSFVDLLVNTSETRRNDIFNLKITTEGGVKINETRFYLFSNQDNIDSLKLSIEQTLIEMLCCDIYFSFDAFMRNWWISNFVLTKSDIVAKLTELSLSPWIMTISGEKHNEKTKHLTQCIKNFKLTIVEPTDETLISKVWQEADLFHKMIKVASDIELMALTVNWDSQFTKAILTAVKFGLTSYSVTGKTRLAYSDKYKVITTLSDSKISKLLWYLDLAPLVVQCDQKNKKQLGSALQLWKRYFKRKNIVVMGHLEWEDDNVFRNLSNLLDNIPTFIIDNFYVSLQGRQEIQLKRLLQSNEEIATCIGVHDLLEMTQKTLVIGETEDTFPDLYISRSVSAYIIDNQKLRDHLALSPFLFIINCSKAFNVGDLDYIELSQYLEHGKDKPQRIILSTEAKCTSLQFDRVCEISPDCVYLIQIIDDKTSVLLLSRGNTSLLEEIRSDQHIIKEAKVLEYFDNPLNFISGSAGTGKSTFFRALSKQCRPDLWSLRVNLNEVNQTRPSCEEFLTHLLQTQKIKTSYLFLDGLDEVAPEYVDPLLILIKQVSSEGIHVWLSSRLHLENKVIDALNVVPLKIVELDEEQQNRYIYQKLRSYYSLAEIKDLLSSVDIVNGRELLQTPLNLEIVTSFETDSKFIYPVTSMCEVLVKGFNKYFGSEILSFLYEHCLEFYQIYSLEHCLNLEDLETLGLDPDKSRVAEKSPLGEFIRGTFLHYFAALWLTSHMKKLRLLVDRYFLERYRNLRIMCDIILATDNKEFIELIHKKIESISENGQEIDKGGRSLLHIACSYGKRCPRDYHTRLTREDKSYIDLIHRLFDYGRQYILQKDELFGFTCIEYAVYSGCLYPLEKCLDMFPDLTVILDKLYEIYDTNTLVHYCSQLGYHNLLGRVILKDREVVEPDNVLEAVLGCKNEDYTLAREGNIRALDLLLSCFKPTEAAKLLDRALDLACQHKCYDMIEKLLKLGAKLHNGTILHTAAEYGTLDKIMLNIARNLKVDIDAPNDEGKSAMHIACEHGHLEVVKVLIDGEVALDQRSKDGRTVLHSAMISKHPKVDIVNLLLEKDVVTTMEDSEGQTPLQLAQKAGNQAIVDLVSKVWRTREDVTFVKSEPTTSQEIFTKRLGTTNVGQTYENTMVAFLALRLLVDDSVEDFNISTNDSAFGDFDDVVVNVKTKATETLYAIQLKHTANTKRVINNTAFTEARGSFSLMKYFKSFQEVSKCESSCKFIIVTNQKLEHDVDILTFDKENLVLKMRRSQPFLDVFKEGNCYQFEIVSQSFKEMTYSNFFDNFFFCSQQLSVDRLTSVLRNDFLESFHANEWDYVRYLSFITKWSSREGRVEKLNKIWVLRVITLTVLDELIRPIASGSATEKMKILRDAMSTFNVTVLEERSYDSVKQIWGDFDIIDEELAQMRTKYHLMDSTPKTTSILLWLANRVPLVVEANPSLEKILKYCEKEKFVVLGRLSFETEAMFRNLADLRLQTTYSDILKMFTVSIQDKKEINLECVLQENEELGTFITPDDLLSMLDDSYELGKKSDLPEPYIRRFLSKLDSNTCLDSDAEKLLPEDHFYCLENDSKINIITADPGMGKTTLLLSLKNNTPPEFWSFLLHPEDVGSLRSKCQETERIEDSILDTKCSSFERNLVRVLTTTNRVVYFWDGFDEISSENKDFVIQMVQQLCKKGRTQWVTCRTKLKNEIQSKFSVLANQLQPFRDEDVSFYLHRRMKWLTCCATDSGDCRLKLLYTGQMGVLSDVLRIPLYIYMFSELFRSEPEWRNFLEKRFSLTDVYKYFIDTKIDEYYKSKTSIDIQNDFLRQLFVTHQRTVLSNFEKLALKSLALDNFLPIASNDDVEDSLGLIVNVVNDDVPRFVHNSFAEYFAASYLSKNCIGIQDFIFDKKYRNVRYFFDLLMAKDCVPHIAVITKNYDLLEEQADYLKKSKDRGGRTPLHLACSWGETYPVLEVETRKNISIISDENVSSLSEENPVYVKILEYLLDVCDTSEYDTLFKMTPLLYAEKSGSLLPEIKTKKKNEKRFSKTEDENVTNIFYYAANFGYHDVFSVLEDIRFVTTKSNDDSLLHISLSKCHDDFASELLKFDAYKNTVNYKNKHHWTPLHIATQHGYTSVVKLLLEHNADINVSTDDGMTPLHIATEHGYTSVVKLLLEHNADINVSTDEGMTPLHFASNQGHLEVTKLLAECLAEVNASAINGMTALHMACWRGHQDNLKSDASVNVLFDKGADLNVLERNGRSPLDIACQNDSSELVAVLVKCGANVNHCDKHGMTPLHAACLQGSVRCVEMLIMNGADVGAVEKNGRSPLHIACQNDNLRVVKLLVEFGANVNHCDKHGMTPLHVACLQGSVKCVKILIMSGADVDALEENGQSPLYIACQNDSSEVVDLLVKSGARVDHCDNHGITPLHAACLQGSVRCVEMLIMSGANVGAVEKNGRSPLHIACQNDNLRVVKLLVKSGARVDYCDNHGMTPLHLACLQGSVKCVETLIMSGAHIDALEENGQSPLSIVCQNGNSEMVDLLVKYGADVNHHDYHGMTPIHLASLHGSVTCAHLLIRNNANVNVLEKSGKTPLHMASQKGHKSIVDLLIHAGADSNIADCDELTPLKTAQKEGHEQIIELLSKFNI